VPGRAVSFDYEADISGMQFASVKEITVPLRAVGTVENCAGVLKLKADLSAELLCECARCLKEFKKAFHQKTEAVI
jgi:uncharacterized protein